ncbi:MAG: hypothetical protein Q8N04_11955 [Nitrospira sp.]|nr:hypothetical protein [Nitrospira sp.]
MHTFLLKHFPTKAKAMAIAALMAASSVVGVTGLAPAWSAESEKAASGHELLMKAHEQLEIAIHYAELAVAPHQPGQGWHRAQTQRAINVVVGAGNPDFSKDVENPGDGRGVIKYLQEAHNAMKGCTPANTCDAIESSLEYLRAAIQHGQQSLKEGNRAGLSQQQARMLGALLRAALGTRETESPTMGAMTYAIRMTEHMAEHK